MPFQLKHTVKLRVFNVHGLTPRSRTKGKSDAILRIVEWVYLVTQGSLVCTCARIISRVVKVNPAIRKGRELMSSRAKYHIFEDVFVNSRLDDLSFVVGDEKIP